MESLAKIVAQIGRPLGTSRHQKAAQDEKDEDAIDARDAAVALKGSDAFDPVAIRKEWKNTTDAAVSSLSASKSG